MDQQQPSEPRPPRRVWRPSSVWKVIGITAAVAAVVVGLGIVGYVAFIAVAVSSWASNK